MEALLNGQGSTGRAAGVSSHYQNESKEEVMSKDVLVEEGIGQQTLWQYQLQPPSRKNR